MEALKGFARRTTQSLREMVSGSATSPEEARLNEISTKVKTMEAKGELICQKVIQAARLMEELGSTLKELGEEYKGVPDLPKESRELAEDVFIVGLKLVETSQEHQKGLKDNGFDLLRAFSRQCAQLREVEETRRHHRLEYDFFKAKVQDLRAAPQKDFTRLPRNEQILESWRVELWRVTEQCKALSSQLYVDGRRAVDRSVLTTVQVLHSFVEIATTGFAQTFQGVQLPSYPLAPVLPPTALPAAPGPGPHNGSNYGEGPTGGVAPTQGYSSGCNAAMPTPGDQSSDANLSSCRVSLPGTGAYVSAPLAWGGASTPVAPQSPPASSSSAAATAVAAAALRTPVTYTSASQSTTSAPGFTAGGSAGTIGGAPSYRPPALDSASAQGGTSANYQPPNV